MSRSLVLAFLFGLVTTLWVDGPALAQDVPAGSVWLQIEAVPTLTEAEDRARAYTGVFSDVAGFQLRSGWYGIVLGPYSPESAPARLAALRAERLVPSDSYVTDPTTFRQRFWPVGIVLDAPAVDVPTGLTVPEVEASTLDPDASAAGPDVALADPPAPVVPEETEAEARAAEAELDRTAREDLQTALQWFGFYTATIDGAFGPGTRGSMSDWQTANGFEATGILTTAQRGQLLKGYQTAQTELGLETVTEAESGIEITLPMALVQFDHYEPPFVHFAERDGSGVRIILISQPGDQATLFGLYDSLQTLSVMPLEGARERGERSFTINGQSGSQQAHAYAALSGGLIKGYMLIWNPKDGERMARVLSAMQASFKPIGDRALDPGLVPMPDEQRRGLLAGLELRRPALSRSGFFVDADGTVLTTTEAVTNCGRITLDLDTEASVIVSDAASGVAILRPAQALSPRSVADLALQPARAGAEIAVSGYSYGDQLPAPTLTFGTFEDAQGLAGEPGLNRLAIAALPGDAGGPVLDSAGAVLGMLLPVPADATRKLPAGVGFAAAASSLGTLLAQAGVVPRAYDRPGAVAPEDLNQLADGMTVLVSCWE